MRRRVQAFLCEALGIDVPLADLGCSDSLELFLDVTELQQLAFYKHAAKRYKRVLDVGANVGVHAAYMAKCGWEVKAFEPDPKTFEKLRLVSGIEAVNAAVYLANGEIDFTRVNDHPMASHIKNKKAAYGDLETITVKTVDCRPLFDWADFAKIDCEGAEADILCTLRKPIDAMVEIHSKENADRIWKHFAALDVPIWLERHDWRVAKKANDLPRHHRDGMAFIGRRGPW